MEDENKDINELEIVDKKNNDKNVNPFKNKEFYIAYLSMILVQALMSIFIFNNILFGMLLTAIPSLILGIIIWLFLRKKSRSVALGILFGGSTVFVLFFVLTGGCGLIDM